MKRFLCSLVLMLLLVAHPASADETRRFLLIVDYIGSDYAAAVESGKVINAQEYQEMQSFSADALSLFAALPPPADPQTFGRIQQKLRDLRGLVQRKADPTDVAGLTTEIKSAIIALYQVTTFPLKPPSLKTAQKLYKENCAECHGVDGSANTTKAKELKPPPMSFQDLSVMGGLSPFKAFNVLSFGIPGTGMASFDAFSEQDRWNLAFYLFTLRFTPTEIMQGETLWRRRSQKELGDLKTLASLTDGELLGRLRAEKNESEEVRRSTLAFLRGGLPERMVLDPLSYALAQLRHSVRRVKEGNQEEAYQAVLEAYLEGFELVEPDLRAAQPDKIPEIERLFLATRRALKGPDLTLALPLLTQLSEELIQVQSDFGLKLSSPTFAFFNSMAIILREGLEAALIVAAILAFLRLSGQHGAMVYVHAGWIGAIGASVLTWLVAEFLITISGSTRELIEGIASLLAAAVLFYVSYWLLAKLEAKKWTAFIRSKVEMALSGGHVMALAGVSFLAVYREGFETVLFYQALLLSSASSRGSVLLGFIVGLAFLSVVIVAIFRLGLRIPLRYFFGFTSGLLYILAMIFAGEGIYRLQQLEFLRGTPLNLPSLPILGIYPNVEGLLVQGSMLILFAASLLWFFVLIPRRVPTS